MQKTKKERMEQAIKDHANGATLQAARKKNNVSYSALQRRTSPSPVLEKGRPTHLTKESELELIAYAKYRSSRGFGLTKDQFIEEATDMVNLFKPHSPPITLLSHKWWEGFKRRHPDFACLRPKGRNLIDKIEAEKNVEGIMSFYTLFEKLNLEYNFTPAQVWNVDETGSSQKEKSSFIVGDRYQAVAEGQNSLSSLHMTMVACINAAGKFSSPLFILKGEEVDRLVLEEAFPRSMISTSKKAWINEDIFNRWFVNWITCQRQESSLPILLIVDNCSSHVRRSTVLLAQKHKVELLALPPNLTHILQPLDVCMFRSFKAYIRANLSATLLFHSTRNLTPRQFIELCCTALGKTFTPDAVKNAFTSIGLFPLNSSKAFERIKKLNRHVDVVIPVTRLDKKNEIISKLKNENTELKKKLARTFCEHKISLAEKRMPKKHQKKVKCPFSQVLTRPELDHCVPVTRQSRKRNLSAIL